ncbi:hypothetical protein A9R05_31425 [Burkholderia sp. KK1]|nr:hypothetical protein A9R05_31425 [Burkholderia sp. KK1]
MIAAQLSGTISTDLCAGHRLLHVTVIPFADDEPRKRRHMKHAFQAPLSGATRHCSQPSHE